MSEAWRKGRAYPIRSWGTEPIGPPHDDREIARDQGVEPFRIPATQIDEEQSRSVFPGTHETPNVDHGTEFRPNVFHQQLSEEEHRRQQEF